MIAKKLEEYRIELNNYEEFLFDDDFFDILYGSSDLRECIENSCDINKIFNDAHPKSLVDMGKDKWMTEIETLKEEFNKIVNKLYFIYSMSPKN